MSSRKGSIPTLVAHLAVGQSVASAARAAGMSLSTAQRRLAEPEVQLAIAEAQADLTRAAVGRLRDMRDQAMDRVSEILAGAKNPTVVLRAAELVLRHATVADSAWLFDKVTSQQRHLLRLEEELRSLDE